MSLLIAIATRALVSRTLSMLVQVGRLHCVALHVRSHRVHLVIGRRSAVTHQVVIYKVSISARHRILVDRLGRILQLARLMYNSVGNRHGLPLEILIFARRSLVLLLGRAARGT